MATRWLAVTDPKVRRDLAKQNTMTVPYGVTTRGMKDQLSKKLRKLAEKGSVPSATSVDAAYLAECNFEAIGTVVKAAKVAMDWLKEAAKMAAGTDLPVRWTTPVGFTALQDYRVDEGYIVDFVALGKRYQLTLTKTGDKLDRRKQSMGIAPNFVHALDAAHLMRTVLFCSQDGIKDFAMIHDSYGVHAGHASRLRDNLRDAFIEQYNQPVLEKFRDELRQQATDAADQSEAETKRLQAALMEAGLDAEAAKALKSDLGASKERTAELRGLVDGLPPLPEMGTLDLEQVRTSEYFFA